MRYLGAVLIASAATLSYSSATFGEARSFPGSLVEPATVRPNSVDVTFRLKTCPLSIRVSNSEDNARVASFDITYCSEDFSVDQACKDKMVEPDLNTLTVMSTHGFLDADKDVISIFLATKGVSHRKENETDPPFVRILLNRQGVRECTEIEKYP